MSTRNAFDDFKLNSHNPTATRELANVKARGVRVDYDPATETAAEAIARQLDLVDRPSHQLPFGLSPSTAAAILSQIDPDSLTTLKGQG